MNDNDLSILMAGDSSVLDAISYWESLPKERKDSILDSANRLIDERLKQRDRR